MDATSMPKPCRGIWLSGPNYKRHDMPIHTRHTVNEVTESGSHIFTACLIVAHRS